MVSCIHLPDCPVIEQDLRPSTVSLTLILSQWERKSFRVPGQAYLPPHLPRSWEEEAEKSKIPPVG